MKDAYVFSTTFKHYTDKKTKYLYKLTRKGFRVIKGLTTLIPAYRYIDVGINLVFNEAGSRKCNYLV